MAKYRSKLRRGFSDAYKWSQSTSQIVGSPLGRTCHSVHSKPDRQLVWWEADTNSGTPPCVSWYLELVQREEAYTMDNETPMRQPKIRKWSTRRRRIRIKRTIMRVGGCTYGRNPVSQTLNAHAHVIHAHRYTHAHAHVKRYSYYPYSISCIMKDINVSASKI